MTRQKNYLNNKNEITKMPVTVGVGTVFLEGREGRKHLSFFNSFMSNEMTTIGCIKKEEKNLIFCSC
jgi:uncharacterized protein YqhQ